MNCICCGQPLTIQTQPALVAGRVDLHQIECRNPNCKLHYVTIYKRNLDDYRSHDFSAYGCVETPPALT